MITESVLNYNQLSFFSRDNSSGQTGKELKKLNLKIIHILESMNDAFLALDTSWRFLYLNGNAEKFFQQKTDQLIGKNLFETYPQILDYPHTNQLINSISNADSIKYEEFIPEINQWIEISAHLVDNNIFIYFNDITHRKKDESNLKKSEEWFRKMADGAPVAIWMSGVDKQVTYFNKQWLNFRGQKLEDELGKGWIKGVHPDDVDYCLDTFSTSFDARCEFQMEYRLLRSDNNYRWMLDTGVPIYRSDGVFEGYIGSCIDITERKELEKRKDEFISIASHELKTPVTSLKAFTQILSNQLSEKDHPQAKQYLSRMHTQINKLTTLIEQLLDINKIEQRKLSFEKHEFDISELVLEIVEDVKAINPDFKIKVKGSSVAKVYGDRDRIGQVVINLLNNAIKYSPSSKEILIFINEKEGFVSLSVKDFGIGIARNHLDRIFDRFFRVPGLRQETFPGLGLGLFISAEIIKRHGGKMTVESKKGKGSTFSFDLPLKGWKKDV